MPILLDRSPATPPAGLDTDLTPAQALQWAQSQVQPDHVIVKVELDGKLLDFASPSPVVNDSSLLAQRTLAISTSPRKDLALTTIGKLAALIEWLAPQHKDVARLLEQGNTSTAFTRFAELISAWQHIQFAYGNLAKLLNLTMNQLPVRDLGPSGGEIVLNEFCNQLAEMQTALKNQDFVLLADILQYEMDGAVANWMSLLESTLAIVEPSSAVA
ncbi:MAG: hypothetical protein FWD61_19010 [Phycisphaerales bacterium]|nr:hypothetical protein [Phycisphaerales bacterium]